MRSAAPAADGFDAAHTGADARLSEYVHRADLAGAVYVGAAADLEAEGVAVGDLDEADALFVAIAEEGERAAPDGLLVGVFVIEHGGRSA